MTHETDKTKVLIIGAGPAGISCALQLERSGMDFILLEKAGAGGLVVNAHKVENYPGFPEGIRGEKLAGLMDEHLRKNSIIIKKGEAISIDFKNPFFSVEYLPAESPGNLLPGQNNGKSKQYLRADYLILATGTRPSLLQCPLLSGESGLPLPDFRFESGIPEDIYRKSGFPIFYSIYDFLCSDLSMNIAGIAPGKGTWSGNRFAVIGGGDAAFDYSFSILEKFNDARTDIFMRGKTPKAIPVLAKRAQSEQNIRIFPEFEPETLAITKDGNIKPCFRKSGKENLWEYTALFIAIGRKPCIPLFKSGFLKNKKKLEKQKKYYCIGDVKNGSHRQTGISIGNGIQAAMDLVKIISEG